MSDTVPLIQTILSGLLSGGGSAVTAFAAVFRDIKKRLNALEGKLGNDGTDQNPKTGLFLQVERFDETVKRLKKDVGAWEDDPPEWLIRLINRTVRSTSVNLEHFHELEVLIEKRSRTNAQSIASVDERLDKDFIERADYERDVRMRGEELSKLREQMAATNGLLRGIMAALDYTDPAKSRPGGHS